jgi:hypothetical protein
MSRLSGRVVESVSAHAAAGGHVVEVILVDREDPAGLGAALSVNKAQPVPCQHRTGDRKIAAGSALVAIALAGAELPHQITLPEVNGEKPPDFTAKDASGVLLFNHCKSLPRS